MEKKNIGELLIECGKITSADLEEGLSVQKELKLKLGETLIRLGKVTRDDIEWILSKQLDIPFVIVENVNADPALIGTFPMELLLRNRVLPLYETEEEVAIATDDPLNSEVFEEIEGLSGKRIKLSSGNGQEIEKILMQTYKREGVTSLIQYVKGLLKKLEGTSFYRIDFVLDEKSCGINVYGGGILRKMAVLETPYSSEQVFDSFASLNVAFLYDLRNHGKSVFLSVYPVTNNFGDLSFPAIIGVFGLLLPEGVAFADAETDRVKHLFCSDRPVRGYPFFSTKGLGSDYERTIFTVDSAPLNFNNFYVNALVPEMCSLCRGIGCGECGGLGYLFNRRVEGIYSSSDLKLMQARP